MKPAVSSNQTIIENLLILILIIIATVLSLLGGMIFLDLENSTVWGRILAMPGIDGSLILGSGHSKTDTMAAVYIGGFLGYFFLGLYLLSVVQALIKKYRDKKGGGTRI